MSELLVGLKQPQSEPTASVESMKEKAESLQPENPLCLCFLSFAGMLIHQDADGEGSETTSGFESVVTNAC